MSEGAAGTMRRGVKVPLDELAAVPLVRPSHRPRSRRAAASLTAAASLIMALQWLDLP